VKKVVKLFLTKRKENARQNERELGFDPTVSDEMA
jgi:hypothetical protein